MTYEINNKITKFTDLKAWQEGHVLVLGVYKATKAFPSAETYSLVDQMRRAAVSVTSNIAEGFGRQTLKEKIQFYYLAQGSLTELKNQLMISKDIGYLPEADYRKLMDRADQAHRLLQGLTIKSKSFAATSKNFFPAASLSLLLSSSFLLPSSYFFLPTSSF